jgi:hypothetical protein
MKKYIRLAIDSRGQLRRTLIVEQDKKPSGEVPIPPPQSATQKRKPSTRKRCKRIITPDGKMECLDCREMKPLDEFLLHKRTMPDGTVISKHHDSRCDVCRKGFRHKWKLGLTAEKLEKLRQRAKGKCEICQTDLNGKGVIDHCHKSGKVRGILCTRCNVGVGMFRESLDTFLQAIKYLEKRGPAPASKKAREVVQAIEDLRQGDDNAPATIRKERTPGMAAAKSPAPKIFDTARFEQPWAVFVIVSCLSGSRWRIQDEILSDSLRK